MLAHLLAPWPVIALALFAFPVPQDKGEAAELERARALLGEPAEQPVNEGARLLLAKNSPAAVEILLETLASDNRPSARHLAPAHYRDIAWEALTQITDLYAQKRVEHELRQAKTRAEVRQWCVELLGIYGRPDFVPAMVSALRDRDGGVRRWAARSLGLVGERARTAAKDLFPLRNETDDFVRANAIEALARLDRAAHGELLAHATAKDKDGGVRCALLGAVPQILAERTEELSVPALRDADWRPRLQAVDNLREVRTKTCVDALIEAVRDGRPIVADRAIGALQHLTREQHRTYEIWVEWWQKNRATFEFPAGKPTAPPAPGTTVASYNNIPVVSDHVAFLIDWSRAMQAKLASKGTSKAEAAQQELEGVLAKLHGRLVFNVYGYEETVEVWSKKPAPLSAQNAKKAAAFAAREPEGKAKDIWQVLEKVVSDASLDTAFLLSSGEPDVGLYVHWNRVTRHLADVNRFHKVTIHTVVYSESDWFRQQLQKIAEVTGGQHQAFE